MIRVLLWLHRVAVRLLAPADLRAEYSDQIQLVFEELVREARSLGRREVLRVWVRELRQLAGIARRLSRPAGMGPPRERRRLLPVLMGGARGMKRILGTLKRRPGYALACVFTFAVGLGLTGAVHSVARVSVLGEIPVRDAERVLIVRGFIDTPQWSGQTAMSAPELVWLADHATSFDGFALFSLGGSATLAGEGRADRLTVNYVSPSFFEVLGSQPLHGRFFRAAPDQTERIQEVVLAHHTWVDRFGADPEILGRHVTLSGISLQVVGVAPRGHVGVRAVGALDAWVPLRLAPELAGPSAQLDSPMNGMYWGVARLKKAVSRDAAGEEVARLHETFGRDHRLGDSRRAGVMGLREHFFGGVRQPFVVVSLGALLVLLACTFNLVAMARLRARERSRELALRTTLGASRARVAQVAAGEGLVLAALGTGMAFFVAHLALRLFHATVGPQLVTFGPVSLDGPDLLAASLVVTALFSVPMVQAGTGARTVAGNTGTSTRLRGSGLVIALETALAVLVLVPALLTGRSLERLQGVELGYRPAGLDAVRVNLVGTRHSGYWGPARFARSVQDSLSARSAQPVGVMGPDMMGRSVTHVRVVPEGLDPFRDEHVVRLQWISVTPGTLATLGIERVAGRDVSWADESGGRLAVVLNERAAMRLWPGESPLGKSLHVSGATSPNGVVVGVVKDARHVGRASRHYVDGDIYLSFAQRPTPWVTVFQRRGPGDEASFAGVRQAILAVDDQAAPFGDTSMTSLLESEESPIRLVLTLTSAYALIAVLLSVIGMASVLGNAVKERRQELAIRAALGASNPLLIWVLARPVMLSVLAGLVLGAGVAAVAVPALSPVLFQVSATDPRAYGTVLSAVAVLAFLAISLPSLETLRIPPAESIRRS